MRQTTTTLGHGNIGGSPGGTYGGQNTLDKIFLLSAEEVALYFGGSELLELGRTESNRLGEIAGLYEWSIFENNEISRERILPRAGDSFGYWWWLRSPGIAPNLASTVNHEGRIDLAGLNVHNAFDLGGLRPALWLRISE